MAIETGIEQSASQSSLSRAEGLQPTAEATRLADLTTRVGRDESRGFSLCWRGIQAKTY